MTYEQVKHLKPEEFKRLCGVRKETFEEMVKVVRLVEAQKQPGRPNKLSIEDQVLLTLEYLREYRTYFHIAQSWGVNESTAYRLIRKVEECLIKSRVFRLPGKKNLLKSKQEIEVVVVDVTETPIDRPKKNKNTTTAVRKSNIL